MKRRMWWWLLQVLSLVIFGLILWYGGRDSWQQVFSGRPLPLLAAFFFSGAAQMISARRLQVMAASATKAPPAPWRRFYQVTMTAQALGLLLPRGVSTIGGKGVGLRALGVPTGRTVWVVLMDNAFDIGLLGVLALPGILFVQGVISTAVLVVGYLLLFGGLGVLLAWLAGSQRWRGWLGQAQRLPRVGERLHELLLNLADLVPAPGTAWQMLTLTALLSSCLTLRFYFISQALDLPAGAALFFAIFPLTQLSLVVALAPGGIGVFDLGWLGLLRLAGLPEDLALTFTIAQRAYVTGFVIFWTGVSVLLGWTVRETVADAGAAIEAETETKIETKTETKPEIESGVKMEKMAKVTIAIQAGGQSSRMGRDKGLVELAGKPMIAHVLARTRDLGDSVLVTTNQPADYAFLDVPLASDEEPGAGALPGLATALAAAPGDLVLLVACDMPFLNRDLLRHMLSQAPDADIVVPRWEGRLQPMCAVYRRDTCLSAVRIALLRGEKRMISFYDELRVVVIAEEVVGGFEPAGGSFFNVNSPGELAAAERMITAG